VKAKMTIMSGKDASVLSYLARHRSIDESRRRRLLAPLTGEALAVGKALVGTRSNKRASKAATALRKWADENNEIAETVVRRKR
jgi:hypothetical protein